MINIQEVNYEDLIAYIKQDHSIHKFNANSKIAFHMGLDSYTYAGAFDYLEKCSKIISVACDLDGSIRELLEARYATNINNTQWLLNVEYRAS
jgi:hypothetical protein